MNQRDSERAEGDDTQYNEGGGRTDESVERVSRVDVGIGNRRSCRGEHARDMRLGQSSNAALEFAAPRQLTAGDQSERDDACEQDPRAPDRTNLAHEEKAAECERNAAGPEDPLCAEAFL